MHLRADLTPAEARELRAIRDRRRPDWRERLRATLERADVDGRRPSAEEIEAEIEIRERCGYR